MKDVFSSPENEGLNNEANQPQTQAENNGYNNGEYRYVPPKSDTQTQYYSQQNSEQTQNAYSNYKQPSRDNNYYRPPVNDVTKNKYGAYQPYNTNSSEPHVTVEGVKPPKKKKSVATIVIIVILCAVLAFGGLFYVVYQAGKSNSSSGDTSSSQSSDSDSSDANTGDDSASAKVESSDSAAKKDNDGNYTAAGVAEKNMDSCVGITVYTEQSAYSYFYNYNQNSSSSDDGQTASGEGSGVIMSEANGKTYIITCAHVISDGSSFKVTLNNGKEYDATMVGYDSQTDIGVLSINKTGLQVAKFGSSEDIEVGEDCVAIGCPGGLEFMNSVTQGIVSALDRPVSSSIGYSNECIQVDAAINPGNSGGALFNMQGQVIGITSSKIASTDYEGMGFAVPSDTAVKTANSLIKNGYVAGRAKIGIEYNTLSNYNNSSSILSALEDKGYKDAEGTIVINSINDESDLKNSDVQQYDMIVAINGKTLTSTDVLTSALSSASPGDTVKLTIARIENNSIKTFEVKCKLIESKN